MIQLRYFQEMSYQEIANEIDEPLSNVKIKLLRAKKLLAEIIQDNRKFIWPCLPQKKPILSLRDIKKSYLLLLVMFVPRNEKLFILLLVESPKNKALHSSC